MLKDIKKNNYKLYYKRDVEGFELPMFRQGQTPDNYYSKTRLAREKKVILSEEQVNNPHAFSQGQNGYYPVWDIRLIEESWNGR